jgi:tetratricopeptide (TPR) repeat protein
VRDTHSLYIDALGGTGFPGFGLTVVLLAGLGYLGLRARSRLDDPAAIGASAALIAAFAVYLWHAGVDWMWQMPAVSLLALAAIAIAGAAASQPIRARVPIGVRIGVVAAAVVFAATQLPGLVSTSRVRKSQTDLRHGDVDGAIAAANDAIDSQPWASAPYVQRGLISEFTGRFADARVDLQRAVAREPTNWKPRLLLARVEAEQGDAAAALATFRAAKALRPTSIFFTPNG